MDDGLKEIYRIASETPDVLGNAMYFSVPLEEAKQMRDEVGIPVNLIPELLSDESIEAYKQFQKENPDCTIQIAFGYADGKGYDTSDATIRNIEPVSVCTVLHYKGRRIAGPWFPSLGHPIMTSQELTLKQKVVLSTRIVEDARNDPHFTDVVISFPFQTKEDSLTDKVFLNPNLGGISFSYLDQPTYVYYAFNSGERSNDIPGDARLKELFIGITGVAKSNLIRERGKWSQEDLDASAKRQRERIEQFTDSRSF